MIIEPRAREETGRLFSRIELTRRFRPPSFRSCHALCHELVAVSMVALESMPGFYMVASRHELNRRKTIAPSKRK